MFKLSSLLINYKGLFVIQPELSDLVFNGLIWYLWYDGSMIVLLQKEALGTLSRSTCRTGKGGQAQTTDYLGQTVFFCKFPNMVFMV